MTVLFTTTALIVLTAIAMLIYLGWFRNDKVFNYRIDLIAKVRDASLADILREQDHYWRWHDLDSMNYFEMVFKFWRDLDSFLPNNDFYDKNATKDV